MAVFEKHAEAIAPAADGNRFGSDRVLAAIRPCLRDLGFEVEERGVTGSLQRPVFFGENGEPSLRYQVDAFNPEWRCGLEVEAGRGLAGNAFYRDIVQAMVMVNVQHLIIAVLNHYRGGQGTRDYDKVVAVAQSLYGHDRVKLPFGLTIVGYGPRA